MDNAGLLSMTGISKSFPGVHALDNVDFSLRRQEVHALVGENGAGKSSLMKVLTGVYTPEAGTIMLGGLPVGMKSPRDAQHHGIAIVHQDPGLFPSLTVAENIFAGRPPTHGLPTLIDRATMERRARQLLNLFDVPIDSRATVQDLGNGQRQIVAIAKALSLDAAILVFDEPTAVLTDRESETLFRVIRRLRDDGLGIVYISHRIPEIFAVSDRITVLRDGRNVVTLETAATSPDAVITFMVGRGLLDYYGQPAVDQSRHVVLEVRGLTRPGVFRDVSFSLRRGEIVGFSGLVGSGRTDVALAVFGHQPATGGEIILNGAPVSPRTPAAAMRLGIAYVSEDRRGKGLFIAMTVADNISVTQLDRLSHWGVMNGPGQTALARRMIQALQIRTPGPKQRVRNLSGGNQQKVALAKWLDRDPQVLIVDEPTSGVDVGAKAEIYRILRALAARGSAVLVISSDLPEVLGISDRVIVMHEGRIAGEVARAEATEERVMALAAGRAEAA